MRKQGNKSSGALARLAKALSNQGDRPGQDMTPEAWDQLLDEAIVEALREARGLNWPAPASAATPPLEGPEWDAFDRKFEEDMLKKERNT